MANYRFHLIVVWLWLGLHGLSLHGQSSIPTHRADGGWVTDWLVLDQYVTSGEQARLLAEAANPDNEAVKEGGVWQDANGRPVTWRRVHLRGDRVNVRAAVGKDYAGKSAFLLCNLAADRLGKVEFRVTSALEATLWLNGQELPRGWRLREPQSQGVSLGDTRIFEGQLRLGANRLLLGLSQLGLDWGFALRALPPERTVLTGQIFDSSGKPILRGVTIAAYQDGRELDRIGIDKSGFYQLSLLLASSQSVDLAFASGDQGHWQLDQQLRPGERLTRNITLQEAVSLSGTLSMLDEARSPHREVTVEALRDGVVVASVLSDEKGHYQFVNLKPGRYQVRCHTPGGYRYCLPPSASTNRAQLRDGDLPPIPVEAGKTVASVDARFAAFKKGLWKHYDTLDGVPNNRVLSLVPSPSRGFWLQTGGGLGFFDGQRFSTIPGTGGKPITALTVTADGTVWFGTYNGLFRWEHGSLTRFGITNGLPDDNITCLRASRSGALWIGTGYGLGGYDGRQFRTYRTEDGLIQNDITALGQTPDGALWVGTRGGLSRFDAGRFVNFGAEEGLVGGEVTALECSSTERLRVATAGALAEWNGHGFKALYGGAGQLPLWVRGMHTARDGRLWLGTERGVSIFDGNGLINSHPSDGVAGGNVSSILAAPEGLLWFATDNGVACLDSGVATYTTKDGLANNRLFDLALGPGVLWLGTQWGGLAKFDGKEFTTVLPDLYVRKLHRSADGALWVGSNQGAFRLDGAGLLLPALLGDRWIMAIAGEADREVWFGDGWSGGGAVRAVRNPQGEFTFTHLGRENGLAHNEVNDILCLSNGVTWLATSAGVSRFEAGRFQNFTTKDGLPDEVVRTLWQGKDGAIWMGTGLGVVRYDGSTLHNLSTEFGLPPRRIWSICQSRDGLMWFGTETHGVMVFDGRAFAMLDTRDGLASNAVLAIIQDSDDQMWFATSKDGLTRYRREPARPAVRLTQVKTGGNPVSLTGPPLRLRVGAPITFNYEALDAHSPAAKRQFRVRLDRAATEPGQGKPATDLLTREGEFNWTPALPGEYALEVQAISVNLVYSEPTRLAFSVFVPWYEQNVWRIPAALTGSLLLLVTAWLVYSNWAQRRESRRLKDLMLAQERAARAAFESKNLQLEQQAVQLKLHQQQLEEALANVKTLRGLVPICAWCKKIRDDNGFWDQLESFVSKHSEAKFSHGICPECLKKWEANPDREG